jgi:anti-anti-sigma regulatory factor
MASIRAETPKIVNLSGSLIVDRAAALKEELSAALAESSQLLVSLSLIEDLDLSCLQVLYAARRSAVAAGKDFHFIGTVPTRIVKRLASAGFLHGKAERAEDFETNLVDF